MPEAPTQSEQVSESPSLVRQALMWVLQPLAVVIVVVLGYFILDFFGLRSYFSGDVLDIITDPNTIGVVAIASLYALVFGPIFFSRRYRQFLIKRFSLFFAVMGQVAEALVGLDPALSSKRPPRTDRYQRSLLRQQRMLLSEIRQRPPSDPQRLSKEAEGQVVKLFREALDGTLPTTWRDTFLEAVKSKSEQSLQDSSMMVLERAVQRLQAASSTVTVRGFVNLVIGIIFALGALYVLRESVGLFSPEQLSRITVAEAIYFVGVRISLALIITLISYFFLSLYKRSLEDAKYYQNEVTKLETHIAGLTVALSISDLGAVANAISTLMKARDNPLETGVSDGSTKEKMLLAMIDKLPSIRPE